MREIIFRGKRIDNGEWVEGDLIHGVNHKQGKIFILPIKGGVQSLATRIDPIDGFEVHPETVGQFTGMLDNNGKKIFEGDIVIYEPSIYTYELNAFATSVKWHNKEVRFYLEDYDDFIGLEDHTIIGNIHETNEE